MKQWVKSAVVAISAVALSTGCASTLKVNAIQPAKANFGAANRLAVVQSEGRRSAREQLIAEVLQQTRAAGHFQAVDRTEEGITLKPVGRQAQVTGAKQPQGPEEVWVRIDVLEWGAQKDVREERGSKGQITQVRVMKGKALLGVTAANVGGKALIAEKEYTGVSELSGDVSEEAATAAAGKQAVAQFLADITPTWVQKQVRLDDEDKGEEAILKLAKEGNLSGAVTEMRGYVTANPTNMMAKYNLAVLLDASGSYQEAMEFYTQAVQGSTKDFYAKMKADCQQRLNDQMALSQ